MSLLKFFRNLILLSFALTSLCRQTFASAQSFPLNKKVIEFGWDTPDVQTVRDHVGEWQNRPFDGVIYSLPNGDGLVFNLHNCNAPDLQAQAALIKGVKWGRFTNNFLQLNCASNMDWTSDADWETVLQHVRLCAAVAKSAGFAGIAFDPESYGGINPWIYSAQSQSKNLGFEQYQQVVRRRGSEFAAVLQRELPNLQFLTFYQYSELFDEFGNMPEAAQREMNLSTSPYGLLPSFLDGMLRAAGPGVQFIDGNERSYWYNSSGQYADSYRVIHSSAKQYVAPELRLKYDRQVRAAQAIYTDYNFNLQPSRFPSASAAAMSPKDRDQLFESNLYYALKASDEYVWIYSENVNWWTNKNSIPPGMSDGIKAVTTKVNANQPLGFDTTSSVLGARLHRLLARIGL